MQEIVLYCKSYRNDFDRVKILLESIEKYNIDNIPFYISVPKVDYSTFSQLVGATIILDEDIYPVEDSGWKSQQVIKSNFWKLRLAENYLCLDSDSYFIRPFYKSDFINNSVPYTVLHEQKELFSWSVAKVSQLGFDPKEGFQEDREKVMNIFDRKGRFYDFGPSPVIWSSKVWESLESNYTLPNNLTFSQLIEYSHSEFSWYGEALLAFKAVELYPVEPLFKVFHYPQQYIEYKQQSITEQMIAQNYMGIIMQSNFNGPLKY